MGVHDAGLTLVSVCRRAVWTCIYLVFDGSLGLWVACLMVAVANHDQQDLEGTIACVNGSTCVLVGNASIRTRWLIR